MFVLRTRQLQSAEDLVFVLEALIRKTCVCRAENSGMYVVHHHTIVPRIWKESLPVLLPRMCQCETSHSMTRQRRERTSTPSNASPMTTTTLSPAVCLTTVYPLCQYCLTAESHADPRNPATSFNSSIASTFGPSSDASTWMTARVALMSVESSAHCGEPVRWPELSYPFCEPGAPWRSMMACKPCNRAQPTARWMYGQAPGMNGETEVFVGIDQ